MNPTTPSIAVCCDGGDPARATDLASSLAAVIVPHTETRFEFLLAFTAERLELRRPGQRVRPLAVDFSKGATGHRARQAHPRAEGVVRACGVGPGTHITDATGGLGLDAMLLARAGASVTCCERHPVVAALLADGLSRATQDETLAEAAKRINLRQGDARSVMLDLNPPPNAVYLDPMFPEAARRGRQRAAMDAARCLVGDDPDATDLFNAACAAATGRVVVKRSGRAAPLGGRPSFSRQQRSTRFDVYLIPAASDRST